MPSLLVAGVRRVDSVKWFIRLFLDDSQVAGGFLLGGWLRSPVAGYCLAAFVGQEQREAEAGEHEPVPDGEAGGAEDVLQGGDVTDAADQGDAERSGQEEPAVGEDAGGQDALVLAADGEGADRTAAVRALRGTRGKAMAAARRIGAISRCCG
jgi:hypothetical protein